MIHLLTEPGRTYCVCSRGGLSSDWKDHPPSPCPPQPPHLSFPYQRPELGTTWCPSPGFFTATGRRRGEGRSGPRARASTVIICSVRMTITRFKDLATCMIAFARQYHPVGHYLPFPDEKTEFQGASFAQGPWPGKAVGWGGVQRSCPHGVSSVPPRQMGTGAQNWGRGEG